MKTEIYYFTGTGNSLFIAKKLSALLNDSKLTAINSIIQNPEITADKSRIGFIFPTYFGGLPKIVEDFINKINLKSAESIFYINTSGDYDGFDCSTSKISHILAKKGKKLNGGYNIPMPNNFIIWKMYDLDPKELELNKLKESINTINNISQNILSDNLEIRPDKSGLIANIVNKFWQKKVNKNDKIFFCTQSCNSCGICEKVCPVNNIRIINKKPVWQHNCQNCLACIHYCPQKAIQTKKSINRDRYHHPDITANDLIEAKKV